MLRRLLTLATTVVLLGGCGASPEARNLEPEPTEEQLPPIDPSLVDARLGSRLRAVRDAAIRGMPSREGEVRDLVPRDGIAVIIKTSRPTEGYFLVNYAGIQGWTHGSLYQLAPSDYIPPLPSTPRTFVIPEGADETPDLPADPSGPSTPAPETPVVPTSATPRDEAIARAQSGVGFSYYWGGSTWDPAGANDANAGVCSGGTCPNCTHSGRWGADCSGFTGKVWQVPAGNTDLTVPNHSYGTWAFAHSQDLWTTVDRGEVLAADAFVYNVDGKGHIFVFASGDGWGNMYAYEARGCSMGIVYNLRTADNRYKAIRRNGW